MSSFIKIIKSKGYSFDYSKSNNALLAETNGIYPLTQAINILSKELNITKNQAKQLLQKIGPSEWHHTSSWYNKTDYYDTNIESILDYLDIDTVENLKKYIEETFKSTITKKEEPKGYYGNIDYLTWSGTRNYPKATENTLENVYIVEKGSFYYIYKNEEDYKNGNLILKKKKDSNGTYVYVSKR